MTALTNLLNGRNSVFDTSVSGIPCLAKVTTFLQVDPWKGSAQSCPSDLDYHGYTEVEFELYDRKGYRARWLERIMEGVDGAVDQVEQDIIKSEGY